VNEIVVAVAVQHEVALGEYVREESSEFQETPCFKMCGKKGWRRKLKSAGLKGSGEPGKFTWLLPGSSTGMGSECLHEK
jgi:hypothetical protein